MINLNNILLLILIIAGLYYFVCNIAKRFRYPENKLFALANLIFAASLSIDFIQKNYPKYIQALFTEKIFFAAFILLSQIFLIIIQITPRWEKRPKLLAILLPQLPGFVLIFILFLNYFISKSIFDASLSGSQLLLYVYYAIIGLYTASAYILFIFKIIYFKNEPFKAQLLPIHFGLILGIIIYFIFYFILPAYFNINELQTAGLLGIFLIQSAFNHFLYRAGGIDYKKFYLKILFTVISIILFCLLSFIFIDKILDAGIINNQILFIAGEVIFAIVLIAVSILTNSILKSLFNKKNVLFINTFKKISEEISGLSEMRKNKMDWNSFSQRIVNIIREHMTIDKAFFYLFNEETKSFDILNNGEGIHITRLDERDIIIEALNKHRKVITRSQLFTDNNLREYKESLATFFRDNDIEIALPAFSYREVLIGILFLRETKSKGNYPSDYIFFLEAFKNRFSTILENLIISEDIRVTQTEKRDKLFVRNIKNKVIPPRFTDIKGIKVSSLYINNSDFGGDIFDSVNIRPGKSGIYLANTSDTGVESAMLALEMMSIFKSQADMQETPEGLLNIINQVLCTSRYTDKYATALYMLFDSSSNEITFSNAAFNTLYIYDPVKDSFAEFDAEGIPVGIDIRFHYKAKSLTALPGAIGLCYSPGISSAIDSNGNNYPANRIKDIIRLNKAGSPSEIVKKIYSDFKDFIQNAKLLNDITLIIFKID